MMLLLVTAGLCCVSAFFPFVNAEAYLAATAATDVLGGVWGVAAAAAVGQMGGKCLFYLAGLQSTRCRWLRRKETRWGAALARWEERAKGRPSAGLLLLLVSGTSGLPPFALVSVLAGRLRVPFLTFVVAGLSARWLRFAALLGAAGWLMKLWS